MKLLLNLRHSALYSFGQSTFDEIWMLEMLGVFFFPVKNALEDRDGVLSRKDPWLKKIGVA